MKALRPGASIARGIAQTRPAHITVFQRRSSTSAKMDVSDSGETQGAMHDTHATPPNFIHQMHWHYQKIRRDDLDSDPAVIDFCRGLNEDQQAVLRPVATMSSAHIDAACTAYENAALGTRNPARAPSASLRNVTVYEHSEFPGLRILPGLLPPETQVLFTSQLMHRDLANPLHKVNLHSDYDIPYPPQSGRRGDVSTNEDDPSPSAGSASFFLYPQYSPHTDLKPRDASKQKPLNTAQFLCSRLRWLTLGVQYDWPTRSYRKGGATAFPSDLAKLVTGLFPHIRPESGVVLLYSGKDYMPVHRDVSEQCERALASFSLGCDGIFVIARGEDGGEGENRPRTVAIRVRSGDCIHLDGEARWAWHAMARTIPGTCPAFLAQWPVGTPGATEKEEKAYQKWKGYMSGKRINISCRQVWD